MTDKKSGQDDAVVKRTVINIQPVSDTGETKPGKDNTDSGTAEIGGRKGPEPTRYGDWEKNGRCIDF
ncbi:DUF1674 domain-containing protein [Leucothrix pacifica]|uniref:DUF1674 domain-containing protein n=1 Tax=Leucothrix pacifica TaxID=1247513 RepID=A0A317C9Q7_9GAMM|nr:succinate dehydrogenase assembly factor 4 [Leucothrix pacifica]PWQ94053.1 DUF1674 domain-containing protein [Leucothrix pacifica]